MDASCVHVYHLGPATWHYNVDTEHGIREHVLYKWDHTWQSHMACYDAYTCHTRGNIYVYEFLKRSSPHTII